MLSDEDFRVICYSKINEIIKYGREKSIYIYGAGNGGRILARILDENGIPYVGFVDEKAAEIGQCEGHIVCEIGEVVRNNTLMLVALKGYDSEAVERILREGFLPKDIFVLAAGAEVNKADIDYKGCRIGRYTYGYKELLQDFPIATSVGRYCSINGTARIVNNHSLDCVTTHPFLDHPLFMECHVLHGNSVLYKSR